MGCSNGRDPTPNLPRSRVSRPLATENTDSKSGVDASTSGASARGDKDSAVVTEVVAHYAPQGHREIDDLRAARGSTSSCAFPFTGEGLRTGQAVAGHRRKPRDPGLHGRAPSAERDEGRVHHDESVHQGREGRSGTCPRKHRARRRLDLHVAMFGNFLPWAGKTRTELPRQVAASMANTTKRVRLGRDALGEPRRPRRASGRSSTIPRET